MRRFKLWGPDTAMVEDPEGEFVLAADVLPIIEKQASEDPKERTHESLSKLHEGRTVHTQKPLL